MTLFYQSSSLLLQFHQDYNCVFQQDWVKILHLQPSLLFVEFLP